MNTLRLSQHTWLSRINPTSGRVLLFGREVAALCVRPGLLSQTTLLVTQLTWLSRSNSMLDRMLLLWRELARGS